MDNKNVQFICQSIKEPFKDLAEVLKQEMKAKAFTTSDFDTLRIQHAYLDSLIQRMENEALDTDTDGGE